MKWDSPLLPVGVGADVDLPVGSGIGNIRSQHSLSGNSLARVHLQQERTTRAAATLLSSVERASSVPTTRDMTRPIRSSRGMGPGPFSLCVTGPSRWLPPLSSARPRAAGRRRRIPRRPRDILSSPVSSCAASSTFAPIRSTLDARIHWPATRQRSAPLHRGSRTLLGIQGVPPIARTLFPLARLTRHCHARGELGVGRVPMHTTSAETATRFSCPVNPREGSHARLPRERPNRSRGWHRREGNERTDAEYTF